MQLKHKLPAMGRGHLCTPTDRLHVVMAALLFAPMHRLPFPPPACDAGFKTELEEANGLNTVASELKTKVNLP